MKGIRWDMSKLKKTDGGRTVSHRRGDRRDASLVRDGKGLQTIMCNLMPKRTDNEVYTNLTIDATRLLEYLKDKNAGLDDSYPEGFKFTLFHCVITALSRMVYERPLMNRFVQGGRMYDRYDITLSFVAKRRFEDHADEALMKMFAKDGDTIDSIGRQIYGDVKKERENEHAVDGLDKIIDNFARTPRLFLMGFTKAVRWLDFWGKAPKVFTDGDPNFSTILATNLGSIKCPSVYHHLNNYGTNSIVVAIGALRKEQFVMPDGSIEIRDALEIGATLDERIADGFYFARSMKLIQYIFENPELLDKPISEPSGFEYK